MADQGNRTITISGEASGLMSAMEMLKNSGRTMYEEFQKQAQSYTDKLDKQARKISELITNGRELLNLVREQNRVEAQAELQKRLSTASSSFQKEMAEQEYAKRIRQIEQGLS